MKILITGSSGFIGFHLSKYLLEKGNIVQGFDSMNSYYDINLKKSRLKILKKYKNFFFIRGKIENKKKINDSILRFRPKIIIHLAAQAGVRYSLENPNSYIQSNIVGFMNILECCRYNKVKGLIYASSSSVYGGNKQNSFSIEDRVDKPIEGGGVLENEPLGGLKKFFAGKDFKGLGPKIAEKFNYKVYESFSEIENDIIKNDI